MYHGPLQKSRRKFKLHYDMLYFNSLFLKDQNRAASCELTGMGVRS